MRKRHTTPPLRGVSTALVSSQVQQMLFLLRDDDAYLFGAKNNREQSSRLYKRR